MKTYEFDVKVWVNAQIEAPTKAAAVAALEEVVGTLNEQDISGWNEVFKSERVTFSGFSVTPEASDIGDEEVT